MKKILFVLMLLVLSVSVFAVPVAQDKYVNDFANVFNSTQVSELRTLFSNVDSMTTAEISLLTVDTVAPMEMSQYAQEVVDSWKIGKADKDNGLLILYAKQENKIWVSTGYGLGGILPDSKVGRILDETFVSARAANQTAEGIVLAAREYADVIYANAEEVRSGQTGPAYDGEIIFWIVIILFFFITPLSRLIKPKCPACKGKTEIIKTEYVRDGGVFGTEYEIITYRCKKCNHIFKKKRRRHRGGFFLLPLGMRRGGFSGGGFGGGGFGGGGAGR